MKIPRDLNSDDIIKLLKPFGYKSTRQTGSHIRLTTEEKRQHHVTVPHHDPIKIGTLSAILGEIANQLNIPKQDFLQELFG
jgi:predicted RNA binding protein YcfA (HicA-like mRNA interferase family)